MIWEKVKLGDLYTVHNGLSKGSKFFGSGYPFLSFSTVFNNYFIPAELTDLVQSNEKEQANYSILRGDVFVTRTSETSDELGMSCVALKDYPTATYNGFTKRMRPIEKDRVLPEYIGYYMRMPSFRGEFQAFSTMTTRASLKNDDLLSLAVMLPSMDVQEKIANILRDYDTLIENSQKQIKLLEEVAHRLYKEWFVDLRFPGYEDVAIVDGVPEGWKKDSLTQIAPIVTGKKDANFGTDSGKYLFFTCAQEPIKAPSYSFDCDAVILAGNGDFNVKLYRGQFEAYQRTYVFSPYNSDNLYLLYYAVKDSMRQLFQGASGSTIKFLTKRMLEEIRVFVPNKDILIRFNQNCELFQRKIEALKIQISLAQEARDRLLPKLMSGEIEV
ncbi:MAG: restriction endonuclease subunit S [Anaerovoracaceae bacterium]